MESIISGDANTSKTLITLSISGWSVSNWETWSSLNVSNCETWSTGYVLTSGIWKASSTSGGSGSSSSSGSSTTQSEASYSSKVVGNLVLSFLVVNFATTAFIEQKFNW